MILMTQFHTSTNPIQYKLSGKKKIFIPKYFMDKYEASSKSTTNIIRTNSKFSSFIKYKYLQLIQKKMIMMIIIIKI